MELTQFQVTDRQLQGVGVIGMADTPGLSAADMQAKLEETTRQVLIPQYNAALAAAQQQMDKLTDTDQVQQMIDEKMTQIGAGDMAASVYDPFGRARNVFQAATAQLHGIVLLSDEPSHSATAQSSQAATPAALAKVQAAAMPRAGGTFTGKVTTLSTVRSGACLRSSNVLAADGATAVSTDHLIFVRK